MLVQVVLIRAWFDDAVTLPLKQTVAVQFEPTRVWSKDATTVPLLQTVLMVTVVVTGAIVCLMGSVDVG